jgi:protein arginine N-methyltransferase 2
MIKLGWNKKPGVKILFGKWQDMIDNLAVYDGIFFDTYGEFYKQLKSFHDILGTKLAENGRYSYFNGLAATNSFFHEVYCVLVQLELQQLGIQTEYKKIEMRLDEKEWKDVKQKYWSLFEYKMPMCTWI